MSIELIEYKGRSYPAFQRDAFMGQYALPFAKRFCTGIGYDIGCGKREWCFPGALPIDTVTTEEYNAMNLPGEAVDYIFSSHCLEHLPNWVAALEHWTSRLVLGGVLFLYLPDFSQEYWRPWNNRKHLHCLNPDHVRALLEHLGYVKILVSGVDFCNSFMIVGEKE